MVEADRRTAEALKAKQRAEADEARAVRERDEVLQLVANVAPPEQRAAVSAAKRDPNAKRDPDAIRLAATGSQPDSAAAGSVDAGSEGEGFPVGEEGEHITVLDLTGRDPPTRLDVAASERKSLTPQQQQLLWLAHNCSLERHDSEPAA